MEKQPCVYLLASSRNGTLYTGVTSDLIARTWQHREHVVDGFTKKYEVTKLVWYELHGEMHLAITREKQIKKWNRAWKIRLIDEMNPPWRDLWPDIIGQIPKANVHGFPPSRE
jgi:putative endonuclease